MLGLETRNIDFEILSFIKKFSSRPASDQIFRKTAFKLFAYQFARNENYRKFCRMEGKSPGTVTSWKEIPAMPTIGFKELVLATFPVRNAVKIFKTSGTTRETTGAHFFDTLKLYEAAILPRFKAFLMPDTQDFSFFFLVSPPKESPNSSLSHMAGVVNKYFAKGKGRFYVRHGEIKSEALLRDLETRRKKALIFSAAFSLKCFLDFLRDRQLFLQLSKGSRLMETGGFKGRVREISKAALYSECGKRLGIDRSFCVGEYGMTELSSQFYDTTLRDRFLKIKRRPFKIGPSWTRTLVINPKSGEEARKGSVGILRHFDLANRGSVLAVQTEDLGRQVGEGFELLGRAKDSELRGCSLNYEKFLSLSP